MMFHAVIILERAFLIFVNHHIISGMAFKVLVYERGRCREHDS
jgi:hypothetical protein